MTQKRAVEDKTPINDPLQLALDRDHLTYTSCYCEENVWKLCEEIERRFGNDEAGDRLSRCFAVFISNPTKSVPIWCQRSSKDPRSVPVVWDYHVILILRGKGEEPSLVYDMDSVLRFPETFLVYFDHSFRDEEQLKSRYRRFFRVISAKEYLNRFASNRSHMKKPDGSWAMPPPDYDPIVAKDGATNNIKNCIDMTESSGCFGDVKSAKQFWDFFNTPIRT